MAHIAIEFNADTGSVEWHDGVIVDVDAEGALESGSVHVDFGDGLIHAIDLHDGDYLLLPADTPLGGLPTRPHDRHGLYAFLGVASTADSKTIKNAYYKMSLEYHPDRNPSGGDVVFQTLSSVKEVFADNRQMYDESGTLPRAAEWLHGCTVLSRAAACNGIMCEANTAFRHKDVAAVVAAARVPPASKRSRSQREEEEEDSEAVYDEKAPQVRKRSRTQRACSSGSSSGGGGGSSRSSRPMQTPTPTPMPKDGGRKEPPMPKDAQGGGYFRFSLPAVRKLAEADPELGWMATKKQSRAGYCCLKFFANVPGHWHTQHKGLSFAKRTSDPNRQKGSFPCKICLTEGNKATFTKHASLQRHMREVHGHNEAVVCARCGAKLKHRRSLRSHVICCKGPS